MQETRRCFRCGGAKFMYKVGAGYSSINMGGAKVNCPLCAGKGEIPKVIPDQKIENTPASAKPPLSKSEFSLSAYDEKEAKQNLKSRDKAEKKRGRPKKNKEV